MTWLGRAVDAARRTLSGTRPLPVWHHEAYRLPIHDIQEAVGIETRRAELALWATVGAGNRPFVDVHESTRISLRQLARVHDTAWLERLTQPRELAHVFGLHREEFPVDEVATTIRLACGGTLAAARYALGEGGPTLNLLGGFHHAFPDRGAGLCPVNDIAVAIAAARHEGFDGRVVVLDLDAHPPDGTAACLVDDPSAWIGSLSGSDWGELPGVDETVIPGADDATYLRALHALLDRAPRPDLLFVLAGGDVLGGDRMGALSLTMDGVRRRDEAVREWVGDRPSVWLPAGGYSATAWRVLAQTAVTLLGPGGRPVPPGLDPVAARFDYVSRGLDPVDLGGPEQAEKEHDEPFMTQEEVDQMFGAAPAGPPRVLGYYTREGIEHGLFAFGFLQHLRRLGYRSFRVDIEDTDTGDRATLTGIGGGRRHLLWEIVVDRERLEGRAFLYLNWMTMRHPLGRFRSGRPRLPGQDVPGLGMAEEAIHLLLRVCERLDLDGILLRPAWLHTAVMSHGAFRFLDPTVQGQYEALLRDLGTTPLARLSRAVADGRVCMDGAPWPWPAKPMVCWREDRSPDDDDAVAAARDRVRFTLVAPGTPVPCSTEPSTEPTRPSPEQE